MVLYTFFPDSLQVADDLVRIRPHAEVVNASHNEKVLHMERQHIVIEAVFHHFRGVPTPPHIDSRKIKVCHVAVGHIGRAVVQVAPALGDAVSVDAHIEMFLRICPNLFRHTPDTYGVPVFIESPDPPVEGANPGIVIVHIGQARYLGEYPVFRRCRAFRIFRVGAGHFHFILRSSRISCIGIDGIEKGGPVARPIHIGVRCIPGNRFHGTSHFHGRRKGTHTFPVRIDRPDPPVQGLRPLGELGKVYQHLIGINPLVIVQMIFQGLVPVQVCREAPENFHLIPHGLRIILPGQKDQFFLTFFLDCRWCRGIIGLPGSQGTVFIGRYSRSRRLRLPDGRERQQDTKSSQRCGIQYSHKILSILLSIKCNSKGNLGFLYFFSASFSSSCRNRSAVFASSLPKAAAFSSHSMAAWVLFSVP